MSDFLLPGNEVEELPGSVQDDSHAKETSDDEGTGSHPFIKSPTSVIFAQAEKGGLDFLRRVGDSLPLVTGYLYDANGLLDLTGGVVSFAARKLGSVTIYTLSVTMTGPVFSVDWSLLPEGGDYTGYFLVDYPDGKMVSVPNDTNLRFRLLEGL